MSEKIIYAASFWKNNAELIADLVKIGYLKKDGKTLDPTYGRGKWWTKWKPDDFTYSDKAIDGVDFTDLPYDDETFDQICFDPPYVSVGGRSTSSKSMAEMYQNFGLIEAPRTPQGVQDLINEGLSECARVLKKGGVLFVKCQDYTSGGKFWPGTYYTTHHAISIGLKMKDRIEHLGYGRPQPHKVQKSMRRNLSTLLVFKK